MKFKYTVFQSQHMTVECESIWVIPASICTCVARLETRVLVANSTRAVMLVEEETNHAL